MLTPSHTLSGVVLLKVLSVASPAIFPMSSEFILLSLVFANAPDFDTWFAKNLNDHENTPLHAPIFWILLGCVGFVFNQFIPLSILWLIVLQALFHLFNDYIFARTTGPMLFWPVSKKNYGIVGFVRKYSRFHWSDWDGWKSYLKYYCKNKIMLFGEIVLIIAGILILILR